MEVRRPSRGPPNRTQFGSGFDDEKGLRPKRPIGTNRNRIASRKNGPMTRTLLAITSLGLLASVSPSTLIAFVVLLASKRPNGNAIGFLVGWNVSLIVVFALC